MSGALKAAKKAKRGKRVSMKTRVLPLPKIGGVLPLLPVLAGLSALGSLAGGVGGLWKTVNEARDARKRLAETTRHNETMESIALQKGKGLFLKPYKKGLGLYMTPYEKQAKSWLPSVLPNRAPFDVDIVRYAKIFGIKHFRRVFMKDALPASRPWKNEASIVNLDDSYGNGTHWVC